MVEINENIIRESVEKNNITYWPFHECSICGEMVGFYFYMGKVIWDGSCACSSRFGPRETNYSEIVNIYNENKSDDFRNNFLKFFKIREN